jgi:hypothetical protein
LPDAIDPKSVPYDDYKELLKQKADLEAQNDANKAQKRNLQSQLSQIRKKYAIPSETKSEEVDDSPPDTMITQFKDEIRTLKEQYAALIKQNQPVTTVSAPNNITYTPTTTVSAASGQNPTISAPEPGHIHNFKYFQPFCTGAACGTNSKNPEFVPEMKCKNCNGIVGSFESVKKRVITGDQPNCPFCGQDLKAVPITDEAKRKVQEYLATPKVAVTA